MPRNNVLEVRPVPPGASPQSPPALGPEPAIHKDLGEAEEEGDFGDEADVPLGTAGERELDAAACGAKLAPRSVVR